MKFLTLSMLGICSLLWSKDSLFADTIFIACGAGQSILRYDSNGQGSTFASVPVDYPLGLAIDTSGNIYVSVFGGLRPDDGKILKYSPGGQKTIFASNLYEPSGLAFDSSGNLYVGGHYIEDGVISRISPSGQLSTFASGLFVADGMAFDRDNNLYVAAGGSRAVVKVTPNGQQIFASMFFPRGVAFDSTGNLFVSNPYTGSILKFAPNGDSSVFATSADGPGALAFDSSDNLYVAMINTGSVEKFDKLGNESVFASGLDNPTAIAIIPEPSLWALFGVGFIMWCRSRVTRSCQARLGQ